MIEISLIRDLVAIFGVIAGFSYYVLIVRNQNRISKIQWRTQLFNMFATTEFQKEYIELLNWDWTDYNDFEKKYGSENNPNAYAKRIHIWTSFHTIGTYVKEGLLDISKVYTVSQMAIVQWFKWKDIIEEQRKRYYNELFLRDWEYLVDEMIKYSEKIGHPFLPHAILSRDIPDK